MKQSLRVKEPRSKKRNIVCFLLYADSNFGVLDICASSRICKGTERIVQKGGNRIQCYKGIQGKLE